MSIKKPLIGYIIYVSLQKIFGERFRELLQERNMKQADFIRKYNVAQKTVSNWYTGRSIPNVETLVKLCKELNASSDFLLGLED